MVSNLKGKRMSPKGKGEGKNPERELSYLQKAASFLLEEELSFFGWLAFGNKKKLRISSDDGKEKECYSSSPPVGTEGGEVGDLQIRRPPRRKEKKGHSSRRVPSRKVGGESAQPEKREN